MAMKSSRSNKDCPEISTPQAAEISPTLLDSHNSLRERLSSLGRAHHGSSIERGPENDLSARQCHGFFIRAVTSLACPT